MSAKGSPTFLGPLYPAPAAGKGPIVSLRQCVSHMDQHTKMMARPPKFNDKEESWVAELQETKFMKNAILGGCGDMRCVSAFDTGRIEGQTEGSG